MVDNNPQQASSSTTTCQSDCCLINPKLRELLYPTRLLPHLLGTWVCWACKFVSKSSTSREKIIKRGEQKSYSTSPTAITSHPPYFILHLLGGYHWTWVGGVESNSNNTVYINILKHLSQPSMCVLCPRRIHKRWGYLKHCSTCDRITWGGGVSQPHLARF